MQKRCDAIDLTPLRMYFLHTFCNPLHVKRGRPASWPQLSATLGATHAAPVEIGTLTLFFLAEMIVTFWFAQLRHQGGE
jgi:hypothetical protein